MTKQEPGLPEGEREARYEAFPEDPLCGFVNVNAMRRDGFTLGARFGYSAKEAEGREALGRIRVALETAKSWDELGGCELPPEGKPRLSEICEDALQILESVAGVK